MKRYLLSVTLLALLTGCGYVPFSGGQLEGVVAPAPADWSELSQASIIQLETSPADPYSVKLWVIGMESALYVHAGDNHTQWVENIEQNPEVRLQIGDSIFELRATRVTGNEEFQRFSDVYETKYGNRPRNENIAEIYLFRLGPRQ